MPDPDGFSKFPVLILLLMLPAAVSAGIFSWTDENGKVHFGDRPPIDIKADEITVRVNTFESAPGITTDDSGTLSRGDVVLYTTQRCNYCRKAKQFLKRKNIRFTEYDVETSNKGKRDFKKLNGKGVPVILVGNQRMNGFSEERMVSMLKNAGYE